MILTISRQLGTEEQRIISRLSQQLHIPVIDRDAVEAAAVRLGFVTADAETAEDERLPAHGTLQTLLAGPKRYANVLMRTVRELAATQSAILLGTAGAEILHDDPQALHVRLVARRDDRIRRVSELVTPEQAAHLVDESDQRRAEFHTALFGVDWHDPHRYHLVLNTSLLTPDQAVAVILWTIYALQLVPMEAAIGIYMPPPCWRNVTISREYGSGGHAFSEMLANVLHWPRYDHELLHQSAALSGISVPALIHLDEHGPGFLERLHTLQDSAKYFEGLREAILRDAAASASIIVGRGGVMLLPSATTLHLRLVASVQDRVVRTMREHWLAEGPARAMVKTQDDARAAFHRHYFRVDWADPLLYHAVFNTSRIDLEPLTVMVAGCLTSGQSSISEEEEHHG